MSKNKRTKILVGVLSASMILLGTASAVVFAEQNAEEAKSVTASNDETVYVLTDADGREYQRIVSADDKLSYDGYEKAELPVTTDIRYTLDGKDVKGEKMAGKSGHMVMEVKFDNHTKSGNVCVPFLAVTAMALDGDIFSNVEVTNGKLIEDGGRSMIFGYALPGVKESLGTEEIDVPDKVTVEADVKNFQMETIYTMMTSEVFTEMNVDSESGLTNLTDNIDKLSDGVEQLLSGSNALSDGAGKLSEGAEKLTEGTDTLTQGIGDLYTGSKELKTGTDGLNKGAGDLEKGARALSDGSRQIDMGMQNLNSGLAELTANSSAVNAGAKQLTDAVLKEAENSLLTAGMQVKLTAENYGDILKQAMAVKPEASAQLNSLKAQIDSVMQFYQGVLNYTAGVDSVAEGAEKLAESTGSLSAGADGLANGAEALAKGAEQLSGGAGMLKSGAEKAYNGAGTLSRKEKEFAKGVQELNKGAGELKDGVKEMHSQLSNQLSKLSDTELASVFDKIKQMEDAAKGYNSFEKGADYDSVKFILKAKEISSPKKNG